MKKNILIVLCILAFSASLVVAVRLSPSEYAILSDDQLNNTISFTHYNTSVREDYVVFHFTMSTYNRFNLTFYDAVFRRTAELDFSHVIYCLRNFNPSQCWAGMVMNNGFYNQSGLVGYTVREQVRLQKQNELARLIYMRERTIDYLQLQNRSEQIVDLINMRLS